MGKSKLTKIIESIDIKDSSPSDNLRESDLLRIEYKAARANARLRSIERAGVTQQSGAYKSIEAVNAPNEYGYQIGDSDVYKLNQKGQLSFRTDIRTMAKYDKEALRHLESRLDIFLKTKSSSVQHLKTVAAREQTEFENFKNRFKVNINGNLVDIGFKGNAWEEFQKFKEEETRSFQTYNANRKAAGRDVTFEQWRDMMEDALVNRIRIFYDSDQADVIINDIYKGKVKRGAVESMLDKMESGEISETKTYRQYRSLLKPTKVKKSRRVYTRETKRSKRSKK